MNIRIVRLDSPAYPNPLGVDMNAGSMVLGGVVGFGLALAINTGVIRVDLNKLMVPKPQFCEYGNCAVPNPLGSKPSVNDFFGSLEGSPSDGHVDHYRLDPAPSPFAVPKAAPKVPRAYQAPLPNGLAGSNSEPQVYYLPIPVPVELPPSKTCT